MTASIDNSEAVMQGVLRDPITGTLMRVNADGSINVSIVGGGGGGGVGTGTTVTGGASITMNATGIQFNGADLAGTGFTSASTAGTALVGSLGTNGYSVGVPAFLTTADLSQNSSLYAGTGFSGTGVSGTVNTAGIQLNVPVGATISSFEAYAPMNSNTLAIMDGASNSHAVPFFMPQRGSFSFIRFPASFSTNSTTYGTTGASMNASVNVISTWNAVVYSVGTGASSQSLISVASGSAAWTLQNSMSVAANGTQYSVTQAITYAVQGNSASSSFGYSISNTNYSIVTSGLHTLFSGGRLMDLNFAASLSAGPYWLIVGYSSGSATNSTGISLASNAYIAYSAAQVIPGLNLGIRIMGSTNSQNGLIGGQSFSTVGGGTTSILPLSAFTSAASNARMYFQFLRSA